MNELTYQCCFCGELVKANNSSLISILAILNWNNEIKEQHEQQFFCHVLCFKQKLNPQVPLYLADLVDDQETK